MNDQVTVLLVEDFEFTRKAEIQVLQHLGYATVVEAGDGESALKILGKRTDIDLIISDWNMPGLDGYKLLEAVRSDDAYKNVPFIIATAQGERSQAEKAKLAGVSAFITKPFGAEELKAAIDKAFRRHSADGADSRSVHTKRSPVKKRIKAAHIQITDHLALGVLSHFIDNGTWTPRYFELETLSMPNWNPVQDALESGEADAAFILAPMGMDLFSADVPVRLVLFAHKNGSICVRSADSTNQEALHDFLKGKTFFLPHILSIHHMLADMFLREIGLKLGPVGKPDIDVFYEVVPPVLMPEFLSNNPDSCGFIVAEPMGTKAIREGAGSLMFLSGELWENHPCCVLLMQKRFIEDYEDAAHEFVEMLVKAGLFIAREPESAARIAVDFLDPEKRFGLNLSLIETVLKDPKGLKTDDMFPVIEDLDRIQRYMKSPMGLGKPVDLERFVDLRFADAVIGAGGKGRRPSLMRDSASIVASMINRRMERESIDIRPQTFEIVENGASIAFTLSSQMHLVDRVVAESRRFLKKHGFETFSEFKLVLRELLINAVEHGNRNQPDQAAGCTISILPGDLFKIEVSDQGGGFDYNSLDMSIPKNSRQVRNRGYAIINAFSKKIEFNDKGNKVTAYVKIHQETQFQVTEENEWKNIRPSGDITASVADKFRTLLKELVEEGCVKFRFDFEKVQDIDSVGLSTFLILDKTLAGEPSELEIINAGEDLNHFFRMTRLDRIYSIRPTCKGDM